MQKTITGTLQIKVDDISPNPLKPDDMMVKMTLNLLNRKGVELVTNLAPPAQAGLSIGDTLNIEELAVKLAFAEG